MSGVKWSGYRSRLSSTEMHLESSSCSSNSSESQLGKQKSIEILVLSDDSQFTLSTLNEGELKHTPGRTVHSRFLEAFQVLTCHQTWDTRHGPKAL